jgi:predicted SprT family Zn-dependent metalloprotease
MSRKDKIAPEERQRIAGLALGLVREHQPDLEPLLVIGYSTRFTRRLGDALYISPTRAVLVEEWLRKGHNPGDVAEWFGTTDTTPSARIRLSVPLWSRIGKRERDDTVAHEVAHLIVAHRHEELGVYGDSRKRLKPHGPEWQLVMARELGYSPRATSKTRIDRTGMAGTRSKYRLVCVLCGAPVYVGKKRFDRADRCATAIKKHGALTKARLYSDAARQSLHHRPCQHAGAAASLLVPPKRRAVVKRRAVLEQLTLDILGRLPRDIK